MKKYTLQKISVNWGQTILENQNFKQKYELAKFPCTILYFDNILTTLKQQLKDKNLRFLNILIKFLNFTLASSLHSHNTRFCKKLSFFTARPRTRLGLNSFRYLGPRFWSSFRENKKKLKKDESKCSLKKFLLTCYNIM